MNQKNDVVAIRPAGLTVTELSEALVVGCNIYKEAGTTLPLAEHVHQLMLAAYKAGLEDGRKAEALG